MQQTETRETTTSGSTTISLGRKTRTPSQPSLPDRVRLLRSEWPASYSPGISRAISVPLSGRHGESRSAGGGPACGRDLDFARNGSRGNGGGDLFGRIDGKQGSFRADGHLGSSA